MAKKKTKILVICGGGIFGAIPSRFLSYVSKQDNETGLKDLDEIDCIAGSSIGGILAVSYASGKSFAETDQIFQARAKDCFVKTMNGKINPLANHKYDNNSIDSVIKDMVGDKALGQVCKVYPNLDVEVACLNLTDDFYYVFDQKRDAEVKLADIGGYTSAAPTYFACRNFKGKCVVDSGLIEVFPLMTSVTMYHKKYGTAFKDMDVFCIGVGQDVSPKQLTIDRYNSLSMLGIATEVITPYVTLSNSMVVKMYGENLGLNSFYYWNPLHTTGEMDNCSLIPDLVKECDNYRDEFIALWNKWLYGVE